MYEKLKDNSLGLWLISAGMGVMLSIPAVAFFWLPVFILLKTLGIEEFPAWVDIPVLWLWAGCACGYWAGVIDKPSFWRKVKSD